MGIWGREVVGRKGQRERYNIIHFFFHHFLFLLFCFVPASSVQTEDQHVVPIQQPFPHPSLPPHNVATPSSWQWHISTTDLLLSHNAFTGAKPPRLHRLPQGKLKVGSLGGVGRGGNEIIQHPPNTSCRRKPKTGGRRHAHVSVCFFFLEDAQTAPKQENPTQGAGDTHMFLFVSSFLRMCRPPPNRRTPTQGAEDMHIFLFVFFLEDVSHSPH